MAQTIKLKRSATTGNAPTTSQLALGELGINTTDGKLFLKKSVSGTESIVEVGGLPLSGGTLTGNLSLGDNVKLQLGNQSGGDLQIYHDGNHSRIVDAGTGYLILGGQDTGVAVQNGSGQNLILTGANAVTLGYGNAPKLATTSTGIDVTGSVTADGLTVDTGSTFAVSATLGHTGGSQLFFVNDDGGSRNQIDSQKNSASADLDLATGGVKRQKIASNGDISFYNDSAAQGLFWDSSTSRLGLGTTAPAYPLDVASSNATSIAYQRTGVSAKKWAFNSDNSNTYWANETDNILAMTLSNAGNASFSGSVSATSVNTGSGAAGRNAFSSGDIRVAAPNDANISQMTVSNTLATIKTDYYGGGSLVPLVLQTGNNNNQLYLSTSGSVGIGTSSPSYALHVATNAGFTAEFQNTAGANHRPVRWTDNTGASVGTLGADFTANEFILQAVNKPLVFGTGGDGAERMRIDSSGNVGIGTSSPSEKLSILGGHISVGESSGVTGTEFLLEGYREIYNGSKYGNISIRSTYNPSSNASDMLFYTASGGTNTTERMRIDSSGQVKIHTPITNDFFGLSLQYNNTDTADFKVNQATGQIKIGGSATGYYPTFWSNNTERMRIDSTGNLGLACTPSAHAFSKAIQIGDGAVWTVSGNQNSTFASNAYLASNGSFKYIAANKASKINLYNGGFTVATTNTSGSADGDITFTDRLTVNSSGSVGIGTNNPSQKLHVVGTSRPALFGSDTAVNIVKLYNSATGSGTYNGLDLLVNSTANSQINAYGMPLTFGTSASNGTNVTERMRISSDGSCRWTPDGTNHDMTLTSGGDLLVGKTSSAFGTAGVQASASNGLWSTRSNFPPLALNRLSSDGSIVDFYKDGTNVGSISTKDGDLNIGTGACGIRFNDGVNAVIPFSITNNFQVDNTLDLGYPTLRFKDLYLSNNATAQKLTLTKAPVGTYSIEVDGTNTGQPNLIVKQSTSERFRCDNNGNLLVGTTDTDPSNNGAGGDAGHAIAGTGYIASARSGDTVALFNRMDNDGNIVDFRKDGAVVGSIGASGGDLVIGTGDTGIHFHDGVDSFIPWNVSAASYRDAAIDLGTSTYRFKDLYLSGNITMGSTAQINASNAFYLDSDIIHFRRNNEQESARIDSSGNLLVGSSSTPSGSTDGTVIFASGTIASYRTGAAPAVFSRNASNGGEVVVIQQQGTTVGSIGTTGGKLEIDGPSNNSGLRFHESSLIPRKNGDVTNGQVDLGYNDGSIILGFRNLTLSNAIKASTLKFENSAGTTEYARFDSSNNLLVGTTGANTYSSTVNTGVQIAPDFIGVARNQNTVMHLNRQGNDGTIVDFRTFGFVRGSVSISGSTTSYNTSSDERLKDNIIDAPIASEDIDAIQVRSFDWKADGEHQKYGMVAQELLEVAPDAVTQGDTPDDMMGVDYSKLVPMLIKEIQSLRQRVAQLEE